MLILAKPAALRASPLTTSILVKYPTETFLDCQSYQIRRKLVDLLGGPHDSDPAQ